MEQVEEEEEPSYAKPIKREERDRAKIVGASKKGEHQEILLLEEAAEEAEVPTSFVAVDHFKSKSSKSKRGKSEFKSEKSSEKSDGESKRSSGESSSSYHHQGHHEQQQQKEEKVELDEGDAEEEDDEDDPEKVIKYIDMATWTADDFPQDDDLDSDSNSIPGGLSPSPVMITTANSNYFQYQDENRHHVGGQVHHGHRSSRAKGHSENSSSGKNNTGLQHVLRPLASSNNPPIVSGECFTISSSQFGPRLYENVPPPPPFPPSGDFHSSSSFNNLNMGHSSNLNGNNGGHLGPLPISCQKNEFLSVSELLQAQQQHQTSVLQQQQQQTGSSGSCGGLPPSRTSWADSGRESLSFDGDTNGGSPKNNNYPINMNLPLSLTSIPPPPPPPHQNLNLHHLHFHHHHGFPKSSANNSPIRSSSKKSSHGHGKSRRRDKLVRQKHAIDVSEFECPPANTTAAYLAVPSPARRLVQQAPSPISLQRHPNAAQMLLLQENKRTRSLIPSETPYGIISSASANSFRVTSLAAGERLLEDIRRTKSPSTRKFSRAGKNIQSFDYGELPSHQMFPKRHLLNSQNAHLVVPSNQGGGGAHRSFPAAFNARSCSMGDLTSSTGPSSLNNISRGLAQALKIDTSVQIPSSNTHQMILQSNTNNLIANQNGTANLLSPQNPTLTPGSNQNFVTSLPLPPVATSVTYEFNLTNVTGTLVPGWNLTAVQRGLATTTAPALAAVVARRRVPRPRPSRFGFSDKTEARRARWTIVVTALALLAMSMLLVGITLRLAPIIDELGYRKGLLEAVGC